MFSFIASEVLTRKLNRDPNSNVRFQLMLRISRATEDSSVTKLEEHPKRSGERIFGDLAPLTSVSRVYYVLPSVDE